MFWIQHHSNQNSIPMSGWTFHQIPKQVFYWENKITIHSLDRIQKSKEKSKKKYIISKNTFCFPRSWLSSISVFYSNVFLSSPNVLHCIHFHPTISVFLELNSISLKKKSKLSKWKWSTILPKSGSSSHSRSYSAKWR